MPDCNRSLFRCLSWLTILLLTHSAVLADTISLDNGNLLSGRIRELTDNKVHLETDWGGFIKVDLRYVQTMETDELLWVRMKGQDNFRLVRLYQENNETWLQDEDGNRTKLDKTARLAALKSDQPDDNRWLLSGRANVNIALKRGEKRETELVTFGTVNVRDRINRNILSWKSDYSKENGSMDDKELKLNYDYNRFLDRSWYLLGSGLWWYDLGESPYKRYSAGSGVGYQFWDRGTGSLKSDVGFSHFWENYKESDDRSRWAVRWGVSGTQQLVDNLFGTVDSIVFYRLGNDDQLLWDLDLGLKYQINEKLWFNLLYSLDLDSTPPEDGVRSKTSLTFGLGFSW